MAILSFILGCFFVSGATALSLGILNLLSAFGISNIYYVWEVDGDSTTGWILLSIGIFVVLSTIAINRKWKIGIFF